MCIRALPPFGFSPRDRQAAAAWASRRGAGWTVEAIPGDDGAHGLGVCPPDGEELAFQLQRTAAGIAVIDAETWETLGVFPTLAASLDWGSLVALRIPANDP